MSEEYREFRKLLRRAIGDDRKQAEFSRESGIAAPQLNRMLNQSTIGRPSISTLKKIAGHAGNGITLKELLISCGYSEDTVTDVESELDEERKKYCIDKRAELCWEDFKNGFNEYLQSNSMSDVLSDDIFDFIESIAEKYCIENISIELDDEIPVANSKDFPAADSAQPFTLSMSDGRETAEIGFGVYFCKTKKGKVFPVGLVHSLTDLMKIGSQIANEVLDCYSEKHQEIDFDNFDAVCLFTSTSDEKFHMKNDKEYWKYRKNVDENMSARDRLLNAIFGPDDVKKRISSVEGMGFYTDVIEPEIAREFFINHKDSFCRSKEEYDVFQNIILTNSKMSIESFHEISSNVEPAVCASWESMICSIIHRETGIRMEFWNPDEEEAEKWQDRPAILFQECAPWLYNETEKDLSERSCRQLLDKYAAELHCEVDDCYFIMEIDDTRNEDIK